MEKRRDKVIDPLDISAGRMSNGPHVQDAFYTLQRRVKLRVKSESGENSLFAWLRSSKAEHQVGYGEHQSQFDARFVDQDPLFLSKRSHRLEKHIRYVSALMSTNAYLSEVEGSPMRD